MSSQPLSDSLSTRGLPPDTRLIEDSQGLGEFLREIESEPVLAVDTEAASFHRYHDRIYLIQVSTRRATAILDPIGLESLAGFGEILADRNRQIVFHDADYDLRLFDLQYRWRPNALFDTRIAAQFVNEPGIGLAALLEKYLGVVVDKKYQRADWSARPLREEMLAYAAMDTRHLIELRDLLSGRLRELGRESWVAEEFAALESIRYTAGEDREPAWLKFKGARQLKQRNLAVLKGVLEWREEAASRLDRAAFRIIGNEAVMAIAQSLPTTLVELTSIKGVGREFSERRGMELVEVVAKALELSEEQLPRFPRPPRHKPDKAFEDRLERVKQVRNRLAKALDLAPGVLCPNGLLEAIARATPRSVEELALVPGVRQWQVREIGGELVAGVVG